MLDHRRIPGLTLGFLLLSESAPARANDTMVTLGAGGLVPVASSDIEMQSETLEISPHRITVTYLFHNASNHDVDATVAFPLPALGGGAVYNEPMSLPRGEDDNFLRFKVTQGAESPPVKMEARAFLDDRDITARLQSTGVPASVLLRPLNLALLKRSTARRAGLEADQLIVPGDFSPELPGVGTAGGPPGRCVSSSIGPSISRPADTGSVSHTRPPRYPAWPPWPELGEALTAHDCALHAYVLMTNHLHLLVTPSCDAAIGPLMQALGRRYVGRVNRAQGRTETL